jgi:hypothetical protein
MDSDTDGGSKEVKIGGKEVMLKNSSSFKKCSGDDAATKSWGMNVITHQIGGKVYFAMWSMDVKIEGQNAVRNLDIMTHNHMSSPGGTPPWPFTARAALAADTGECSKEVEKAEKACTKEDDKKTWKDDVQCPDTGAIDKSKKAMTAAKRSMEAGTGSAEDYEKAKDQWNKDYDEFAKKTDEDPCQAALRCLLVPYKGKKKEGKCCKGQTGDHLLDASCFFDTGRGGSGSTALEGCEKYKTNRAPVMCVEGQNNTQATHGDMHTIKGYLAQKKQDGDGKMSLTQGKNNAKEAVTAVFPDSACSGPCIDAQLKKYHEDECEMDKSQKINAASSGRTSAADAQAVRDNRAGAADNG